jgi:hypothetical protein
MENPEMHDADKARPSTRKQVIIMLAAFLILCLYFAVSWIIDIRFASKEEARYSKDLLSKAQAAGDIVSGRVKNLENALDIFRRVYLTEFAGEKRGIGSVIDLFEEELDSFPELVSLSYMNAASELVYARGVEGDEGEAAVNASIDWSKEYWARIGPDDEKPFYTPLKLSGRNYLQGILFPVAIEGKIAGGLIAVTDAGTVASKSLELVSVSGGTAAMLLDTNGAVIAFVKSGGSSKAPVTAFITSDFMKKALSQQNGIQIINPPAAGKAGRSSPSGRMIVAWQQVRLGSKDALVILASPEEDTVRVFRNARFSHMVLEFVFALIVSIAIALVLIKRKIEERVT